MCNADVVPAGLCLACEVFVLCVDKSIYVESVSLGSSYIRACTEYFLYNQVPIACSTHCMQSCHALFPSDLSVILVHHQEAVHSHQASSCVPALHVALQKQSSRCTLTFGMQRTPCNCLFHVSMHYLAKIASLSCSQVIAIQLDLDCVQEAIHLACKTIHCVRSCTYIPALASVVIRRYRLADLIISS